MAKAKQKTKAQKTKPVKPEKIEKINEQVVEEFDDDEEDEFDEENNDIIRAKWSFDGATTLTEAAEMLKNYADEILKLEKEGWQLESPIEDDYGFIKRNKSNTPR